MLLMNEMDGWWGNTPERVVTIVGRCFSADPAKRPTFDEIVSGLEDSLESDIFPDESGPI